MSSFAESVTNASSKGLNDGRIILPESLRGESIDDFRLASWEARRDRGSIEARAADEGSVTTSMPSSSLKVASSESRAVATGSFAIRLRLSVLGERCKYYRAV